MKTTVRDPLGKLDRFPSETRQFVQEDNARSVSFAKEPERTVVCCKRFLGKTLDCAHACSTSIPIGGKEFSWQFACASAMLPSGWNSFQEICGGTSRINGYFCDPA